jgi:hypothetical protein
MTASSLATLGDFSLDVRLSMLNRLLGYFSDLWF